jgi:hypothetical protein
MSGFNMETRVANIGGGMRVSSNSLTLSLSLRFSSSILTIKTSNASPLILCIDDSFDGNMFLVSMMDCDFPFLFFEILSKVNFFEVLSNKKKFTEKIYSPKKTSS